MNHEWRDEIFKAFANHEVSCVGKDGAVKACDVAFKVIETVAGGAACCVDVDAKKCFHDVYMVWYFICRNDRIAVLGDFYVVGIVRSDWNGCIYHLRDDHHALGELFGSFCFCGLKCCELVCDGGYLFLFLLLFGRSHNEL